jgi:hypothetical protein
MVTVAVPRTPSTNAVTVVVPGVTAVSIPCADIVATTGSATLQVTGRPVRTCPNASRADAV